MSVLDLVGIVNCSKIVSSQQMSERSATANSTVKGLAEEHEKAAMRRAPHLLYKSEPQHRGAAKQKIFLAQILRVYTLLESRFVRLGVR